jgi:hypothetical protein
MWYCGKVEENLNLYHFSDIFDNVTEVVAVVFVKKTSQWKELLSQI